MDPRWGVPSTPYPQVRDGVRWNPEFAVRQPENYDDEDRRLHCSPNQSVVDIIFKRAASDLDPPGLFSTLKSFLHEGATQSTPGQIGYSLTRDDIALVDDRCDPVPAVNFPGNENTKFARPWENLKYLNDPPVGANANVYTLRGKDVCQQLVGNRNGVAERRVIYTTNLTPKLAFDFMRNVSCKYLSDMLYFFERHIGFNPCMRFSQSSTFVLEFHIPYFALRSDTGIQPDARGLRRHRQIIPAKTGFKQSIYEVQMSLIVFGTDEFFWQAYFFHDTYYDRRESPDYYLQKKLDAPSRGSNRTESPIWDPRYYFLTVFSSRLSQAAMEWTALVHSLEKSLDPYSDLDETSLHHFLETEPGLERTKQRTWTLCILGRLRNTLAKLIATWHTFDTEQSICFDLDIPGALPDRFREKFSQMRQNIAELRRLQMTIDQRIESLEKMSAVLVNASALSESITARKQGKDIQILTYITILYLPVSLITSGFGMNIVQDTVPWWNYWVSVALLTVATAMMAFGLPRGFDFWQRHNERCKKREALPFHGDEKLPTNE